MLIAPGQAQALHVHLAHCADRHPAEILIKDEYPRVVYRPPNRHESRSVSLFPGIAVGYVADLCAAIYVPGCNPRYCRYDLRHQLRRARLHRDEEVAQGSKALIRALDAR